jgi:hypothetical protein
LFRIRVSPSVPQELYTIFHGFPRPGASGASQVLRRLSSCMPRPEDSGGPAPPRPNGGACIAFGSVKTLGVRNKRLFEAVPALQGARSPLRPTGYSVYASPILFTVSPRLRHGRKTRYGWMANPYPTGTFTLQETPSFLGAITLALTCCRKPQRGTSGGCRQSGAVLC